MYSKPIFVSSSTLGHRRRYEDIMIRLFGGEVSRSYTRLFSARPVVWLLVEDHTILFVFWALARSILRRRSIGLLFRVSPCLKSGAGRHRIKRLVFSILRNIKSIRVLSIIPDYCEPSQRRIVDDWIYDLHLWDLTDDEQRFFLEIGNENIPDTNPASKLYSAIKEFAQGRKILISVGRQSKEKGFIYLSQLMQKVDKDNWCVVIAGKIDSTLHSTKSELEKNGALIFDRFVVEEELFAIYAAADLAWLVYDECYDQASGILGHAAQLGCTPLVREHSKIHTMCVREGIPNLSLDIKSISNFLLPKEINTEKYDRNALRDYFANRSISVLKENI